MISNTRIKNTLNLLKPQIFIFFSSFQKLCQCVKTEAVVQRCSVEKGVLSLSLRPATLLKRDSGTGVFL